ncbi:hypothetical protein GGI05_007595, partial [Coemansia sp. RSA 2603]
MPTTTLTSQSSSVDESATTKDWLSSTVSISTAPSTSVSASDKPPSSSSVSVTSIDGLGVIPSPTSTTRFGFADIFSTVSSTTITPTVSTPGIASPSPTATSFDTLVDLSATSSTVQTSLAPLAWAVSTPSQSLQLMGSLAVVYPFTTSIPLMVSPINSGDTSEKILSVQTATLPATPTTLYTSSTTGSMPTQASTSSTSDSLLLSSLSSVVTPSTIDTSSSALVGWFHSSTTTVSPRPAESSSQPHWDQI